MDAPGERTRALVLLGHGSHLSPDSSAPVYEHAERIRRSGRFDQVLEAFWKEEPSLRDALDLVDADDVFVVPLFLAEGYFTREVLPRELGIDGPVQLRGRSVVRYCPAVGTHPSMADLILRRAREAIGPDPDPLARTALVVIGHGTGRSPTSGDTVHLLVERMRRSGVFGTVTCGFLDEEPAIGRVLDDLEADDLVLVPFFVAEGWHTRHTIPHDLGLAGPVTRRGSRTIRYTAPVGTLPDVADVVLEITEEAGRVDVPTPGMARGAGKGADGIAEARAAFFDWLEAAPGAARTFLQLSIGVPAPGRYSLRHRLDADLPLVPFASGDSTPAPAPGGGGDAHLPDRLPSLRARALEIARFDDHGRYRPLRTAGDLRRGWAFHDLHTDELWEILSLLLPTAVLHWHRGTRGSLDVVHYRAWAARQTAMYAPLRHLDDDRVATVASALCGSCLRRRLWSIHPSDPSGSTAPTPPADVPCREPCTVFATAARELESSSLASPAGGA